MFKFYKFKNIISQVIYYICVTSNKHLTIKLIHFYRSSLIKIFRYCIISFNFNVHLEIVDM